MDPKEIIAELLKEMDLPNVVQAAVASEIEKHGLDKVSREYNVAAGSTGKLIDEMTKLEKMNDYCRAWYRGDIAFAKQLSEGTDSEGGYTVPEEFHAELIGLINDIAIMRPLVTKKSVGTDAGEYPVVSAGLDAALVPENTPFGDESIGFTNLLYNVVKLGSVLPLSRELFEDNKVNLYGEILAMYSLAMSLKEDYYMLLGSGIAQPLGILADLGTGSESQAGGSLVWNDLKVAKYAVPASIRAKGNLTWIGHPETFGLIDDLTDGIGRPQWQTADGDRPATLLGYPWAESSFVPNPSSSTGKLIIFDGSEYWLFDREQITFETSREGQYFTNHQVGVKCFERIDGKLSRPGSVVILDTIG